MKLGDKIFSSFLTHYEIIERVKVLASQINKDYEGKEVFFVVLLNGAFIFAADLIKEIVIPCKVSFVKVASYSGTESKGTLKKLLGQNENLEGENVIIIDDIVDSGLTMEYAFSILKSAGTASVELCSLLLKPDSFTKQFEVKYVGFTIPNKFVVGYGLDYNGYGRNLKDLLILKEDAV
jgi:hypoxanthine phosphoribosyltransferase